MEMDPFLGDVKYLRGEDRLRRRIGDWRIFFRLDHAERILYVLSIERRTSTTY
jgi:mRNA-degrading endonuclease RelE of RelBE toxin-antitoxin system